MAWLFAALLLLISVPALAIDHHSGVWAGVVGSAQVDARLLASFEVHLRQEDTRATAIMRPAVGLRLSDHWATHAGYAWIGGLPDGGPVVHEHRAWSQLSGSASVGDKLNLTSRTRLEHRVRGEGAIGHRARQFVRVGAVPAREGGASPVLWNELFLGLNKTAWGAVSGVDQNRLFVGAALPLARGGRFELGVLHVAAPRDALEMTWVASAQWFPTVSAGSAR